MDMLNPVRRGLFWFPFLSELLPFLIIPFIDRFDNSSFAYDLSGIVECRGRFFCFYTFIFQASFSL